ncbi:uncharacterized protein LOC128444850 isoform X2 [Pleuronectes platessa]|uniref:uncharacterized protein LOC128444850 isoform X2 n=1 Tax=Pleuronectes platessa TaxID=8262 RepID=UPI00232A1538|nr:uncharacterized protein LOC128444850 isoform X2 [Pleuronectes platessa]
MDRKQCCVSLSVQPSRGQMDEKFIVLIQNAPPGFKLTVHAFHQCEDRIKWEAFGHYTSDATGTVNVSEDLSLGGTYSGVEPMGLLWSLIPVPGSKPGLRMRKLNVQTPMEVTISVYQGHQTEGFVDLVSLASVLVERWHMAPGIRRIPITEDGLSATLFLPPVEDCKRRWKQLRDAYVIAYAGGTAFEEDEEEAGPSTLPSRPATHTVISRPSSLYITEVEQRTASIPHHPRVQALTSGSATNPSQPSRREKRRGSSSAVSTEQQLLDILTADYVPLPTHVPTDGEEMYFFALSLVPKLKRLSVSTQARAQIHILQYLTDLAEKEDQRTQNQLCTYSSATQYFQQHTSQPQTSAFKAYPSFPHNQQVHTPPPTTYQAHSQPQTIHQPQQGQAHPPMPQQQLEGVKRPRSMLDPSSPTPFSHFDG